MFIRLHLEIQEHTGAGLGVFQLFYRLKAFDLLSFAQCRVFAHNGGVHCVYFSLEKADLDLWLQLVDDEYGDIQSVHEFLNYIRLKIQEPAMAA